MALRGHANIQGATDIATLYDLLPGYLPMPSALRPEQTLDDYLKSVTKPTGWWANTPKYVVSLLKAFYGKAAMRDNDYCFEYLPQLTGDHSTLPTIVAMKDGTVKGYVVIGQNPATSNQNAELVCAGLERLDWFVNIDSYESETCSFWNREGADPAKIATECFFLPAATILEKEGTMVQTSRLLQWHDKAVEPAGDSRSDLWYFYELGKRLKAIYAGSSDPKDRPILDMTWDYDHEDPAERAHRRTLGTARSARNQRLRRRLRRSGEKLCRLERRRLDRVGRLDLHRRLSRQGNEQSARAQRRRHDGARMGMGVAGKSSHALQSRVGGSRRQAVERAQEVRLVGRADKAVDRHRRPRFPDRQSAVHAGKPGAGGMDAHSGADPFIMNLDGKGQIFVDAGLKDAPLPTHYEPRQSVIDNLLYAQQNSPLMGEWARRDNAYNEAVDDEFPHVLTSYRITEHSGIMTRYVPWLAELQPAAFCEIDPELAVAKGIVNGDWVTLSTRLGSTQARALVTGRLRPLRIGGKIVHQIGLPYNYGRFGLANGDSPNELIPLSMDPNVSIHEGKSLTCNIRAGRRARYNAARSKNRFRSRRLLPTDSRSGHGVDDRNSPRSSVRRWGPERRPHITEPAKWAKAIKDDDRILHRYDALHRLQGLRSGVQTVERTAVRRFRIHRRFVR